MLQSSVGQIRHYASIYGKVVVKPIPIKHDFHNVIKWVRPERLKPWHPQRSCDLQPLQKADPNWLKLEYRPFADTINKLPEEQRKLFTVGYGHRKDGTKIILNDTLEFVKNHQYDRKSLECKIARATVNIRNFQELFETNVLAYKDGFHRKRTKELIEKRKKWLCWIRQNDYKKFEWIIELMGLLYKPPAMKVRIERKASINVLVNMFCNELREKKMNEYKEQLEAEKVPFLEMKLDTLEKIKADEESINIKCSVEDDIKETKALLQKLKTKEPMTIHHVGYVKQITS